MTRWGDVSGDTSGEDYQRRFDALAASGRAVHGEADFVAALAGSVGGSVGGTRILDAGCGTGRVAIELSRRGFEVVGVDVDVSMLSVARDLAPGIAWLVRDLAALDAADPDLGGPFDVVVLAGNVIPLLAEGTESVAVAQLAGCLSPGGRLVAGFGLDVAHLPLDDVPVTLADYHGWCSDEGLEREAVFSGWEREPFTEQAGYAVSVHRRTPAG